MFNQRRVITQCVRQRFRVVEKHRDDSRIVGHGAALEQQAAILVVTHDEKVFDRFDRIFMLRDGRLDGGEAGPAGSSGRPSGGASASPDRVGNGDPDDAAEAPDMAAGADKSARLSQAADQDDPGEARIALQSSLRHGKLADRVRGLQEVGMEGKAHDLRFGMAAQ